MSSAMWEFHGVMLTAEELVRRRTKLDLILPTKGPKCFTPSGSWLERKQLQTLLDATKTLIAEERVERENALAQAEWDENLKVARVTRIVGRQFEKFGHEENMTIFLYPEEALYLLETNHLQLLFGGVSMSIQQAYTVLLGTKTGCNFVEYMVFSHLLKNGFKVLRHSAKRTVTRYERLIGLHLEQPRNRKSRRKSVVPQKQNSCESNNKRIKTDQRIQSKIEKHAACNKTDLHSLPNEFKEKSSEKFCDVSSVEATADNNSSLGSDIEILSEKSGCRSERSLVYSEYSSSSSSSSSSHDSDCQVIEEIKTETNEPKVDRKKFCYENKVIEEINLSDSDSGNVECSNIEGSNIVKKEDTCEVELCDVTELNENTSLQDEQSISNVSYDTENDMNRNAVLVDSSVSEVELCDVTELQENTSLKDEQSISNVSRDTENDVNRKSIVGSPVSDRNNSNDSCVVGQMNSNQLMESVGVAEEVQVERTIDRNDLKVCIVGDEKLSPEHENCKEDPGSISILCNVKEESCSSLSAPLPRESVIQINTAVSCEKEINIQRGLKSHCKEEEIEVINLDDENSESGIFEDRNTILLSFPNTAGCHVIRCNVPPQRLCPPNVCPIQQTYNIDLERLQDPRYGGNPKRKVNLHHERYQYQCERNESAYIFRNSTQSSILSNRFSNVNNPFPGERHERWHDFQNQSRDGFPDYSGFSSHNEQLMYSNFQSSHIDQSDQNLYPHFSGQLLHNASPYQCSRINMRSRGNPSPGKYPQNSPFRNCHFRSSRVHRFPRRSRGGRNTHGGRYFVARDREHNESLDETDGNYVPFNVENTHFSCTQSSRTQQSPLGEKRHRNLNDENINSSFPREKRPRNSPRSFRRGNYFPPTRSSHHLLEFLDNLHPDTTNSTVPNSVPVVSSTNCDNNVSDFRELEQNASAFAETQSTDNSSSRRSSCSDSCSSEGSTEESGDESCENEAVDSVSVLLKSDNVDDIDTCLKSLEIVHTVKFKQLIAETGEPLLSIKFDLYQPSTPFRRSNPPVPDFRVVVMQPDQNLPSSRQLAFLGEGFEDDVPLMFAVASTDSVAFYLQSVVDLPTVSTKEKIQG